jgi:hypothetical protein
MNEDLKKLSEKDTLFDDDCNFKYSILRRFGIKQIFFIFIIITCLYFFFIK